MSVVIARRYARAFFDLAVREKATAPFCAELDHFHKATKVCADLVSVLSEDELPFSRRERLVDAVASHLQLSPLTRNFLKVLVQKRRIRSIGAIVEVYHQLLADLEGVVTAEVTTTVPVMDAALSHDIEQALSKLTKRSVVVDTHTNPSLIGGLVVRVGDVVYDGSVTTELKRMREYLIQ